MGITLTTLQKKKAEGTRITMLTAYDASFAGLMQQADIDCLLVGDSLGMVVAGHVNTTPVSVDDMAYHAAAVARGAPGCWRIVDMPFMSYATVKQALASAQRLMQEGQANMVKLEGGHSSQLDVIRALSEQNIAVCAHLGLTPQTVDKLGGYRTVGKRDGEAEQLREQALAVQAAGAEMLVLECIPRGLAAEITAALDIPVIGIGCGPATDGQVLVSYDAIGISPHIPYFSHNFLEGQASLLDAFAAYREAVISGAFPGDEHARD
ncbi:3-methyl-2-oxobutanoate hydroxymethyltransferase [Suttonella sp. R2A3]|uniref:3-methyl-2-oxobutanoate hydroxymethyltransferase n=1 Tax=Suttonella sp. R2A3 TaxID=2908648 RepID=UPI001F371E20|nr:3-methyl-2-oxobutanoate hydroxymethyltransferase [Suttonella sp. R2A3]UJF25122.1 3-methyl-2-oxobutanoate hydroxymethyltransferase [Suttonella sp. R2A3]